MRKWVIAGVVFFLLCVVVAIAVVNINALVKHNKSYLVDEAQQALGRKISVGDVDVTLLNGIGMRFKDFAMSDDPAYSSDDFVRAKDLQINLKFWPLLRGKLEAKRLILHDPAITVVRNARGDFNFSTVGNKEKQKAKEKKERTPRERSSDLFITLVNISGGTLRYRDLKEGADLSLQQIDLKLEDLDSDQPFSVTLAAALFAAKQNLTLKTSVGPLRPDGSFSQVPLDGELQIDAFDMSKLRNAVPQIKAALPKDLDLSGIFKIKNIQFKGTLQNLALKADLDGTQGMIHFGKSFQKPSGILLTVSSDAQYSPNSVSLRQSKIQFHTVELVGGGEVKLGDSPELSLSLSSKPIALSGWEKIITGIEAYQLAGKAEVMATVHGRMGRGMTPEIQGVLSLAGVSIKPRQFSKTIKDLNATINFTGQRADIKETTFSLGDSRIRLAGVIEKFSPLTLSYKMSTPEIWPADFQAALSEDRKSDVIKALTSEGRLAMQEGNVTVQGKLLSAQGILYKIGYKNLDATLSLANKVANIRSLRASALGGAVQAEGEYAFDNPVPRFSLDSKVQGVDVKELYSALTPKAERDIRGRLNADIKISGSGEKWEEIKPTLRGQGEAEVLQGALLNFNVADGALSGITGMPGVTNMINPKLRSKYPATFESKDTEFNEMKAVFDVADGRINVKSLRIAAADYFTQGSGWVDFDRKVDFRSVLTFSQPLSADIAQSAREVKFLLNAQNQLEMPFAVKGKLPNVRAKPDANYLGKMVQRGLLGKGAEELQKQFFGNKDPKTAEASPPAESQKRKKSSTEDRIRKGLEELFRR